MLLLSLDTSGKHGSIALARADGLPAGPDPVEVIEVVPLEGGTFSAQLVPQIASLLAKHGFSKRDIGAFVVAWGPGSFTGLRVGLAVIKALAEILEKPIAAVSLLEASAVVAGIQGRVLVALDAGRGDVYSGEYEVGAGSARMLSEQLVAMNDFVQTAKGVPVVTSDAPLAQAFRAAGLVVQAIEPVRADSLARIGVAKIRAGCTVAPDYLDANYVRRSDAEIFAKRRS